MSITAIQGSVEPSPRVSIAFPFYSGMAGKRDRGDLLELAFYGDLPTSFPVRGTIEGSAYRVISARKSDTVKGMVVVTAQAA